MAGDITRGVTKFIREQTVSGDTEMLVWGWPPYLAVGKNKVGKIRSFVLGIGCRGYSLQLQLMIDGDRD